MVKARKHGINTPYVLFVDYVQRKIYMQYVANSIKMRDFLNKESCEPTSFLKNLNRFSEKMTCF